jgi:hypothetical protein
MLTMVIAEAVIEGKKARGGAAAAPAAEAPAAAQSELDLFPEAAAEAAAPAAE